MKKSQVTMKVNGWSEMREKTLINGVDRINGTHCKVHTEFGESFTRRYWQKKGGRFEFLFRNALISLTEFSGEDKEQNPGGGGSRSGEQPTEGDKKSQGGLGGQQGQGEQDGQGEGQQGDQQGEGKGQGQGQDGQDGDGEGQQGQGQGKGDQQQESEQDDKRKVDLYFPPADAKHQEYDTIKSCIESDIPVYLVGEAGTGKNYTLQKIAEELGLDFYFTNSVQQEYKVTGFVDAGGKFHETEFYKAFKYGGVFFLDEIDASIPEVLVLLNAAIANRYFEFPNGKIDAHPDFRVVSAGNTVGSGADELYTGRLVLDQATLDRFVIIEFDYDRNIEMVLAKGNKHLVNFIRSLRSFAKENGIRATFSYRAIMSVVKLEKTGLPLAKILKIAVFKGFTQEVINTFEVSDSGKYYYAMKEIQK